MKKLLPALLLLASLNLNGCANHCEISQALSQEIEQEFANRELTLRHSLYFGPMYDDERFLLLSEWPFANTALLADSHGQPLTPGKASDLDIVPIGTRMKILHVEFPDKEHFAKRLLFTPRFNPWVLVKVADNDAFLPNKIMVLPLPMKITSHQALQEAIFHHFGTDSEVQNYLSGLDENIRTAIAHKEVHHEMNYEQLERALGKPLQVEDITKQQHTTRIVTYGHITVTLFDDKVQGLPQKNSTMGYHIPTL